MQAKVSSVRAEPQKVAGRVIDSADPKEECFLVTSECNPSRSNHPSESAFVYQSPIQPTQQISEALLWHKMTQVVANAQPEAVLSKLAAILGEEFKVEGCVISICTQRSTQRQVASWFGNHLTATQQAGILATYSVEAATLDAGNLIISDLQTSNPIPALRSGSIGSVLSIVTRFQGQPNGAISLMRSDSHSWTELEATTLTTISDQIAVTISQILLQQQALKQAQYQSLIQALTIAIQNSVDLPQILKLAVDGTAQALEIAQGSVLRLRYWDPRHNSRSLDGIPKAKVIVEYQWQQEMAAHRFPAPEVFASQSQSNLDSETLLSQSFWVAECLVCQSAVTRVEPTVLSDRGDFPVATETNGIAPLFEPDRMPSLLMVPLESKNKLLGFITLQYNQPRVWQPDEIEFAELVSAQVSSAIMQTETLRQVEALVEERTAQLQQSLELQAKLYEITRKQIEKLRVMNQRMDEFLSTLSHELRTPLTSMMLAIRMLREADLSPDRRAQYLNILEQQCAQETSLINDLLALQELESKQVAIQLQRVDLKQMITEISQAFNQRWAPKGLTLEVELPKRSLILNTDLTSLNRILLELLTNAGKYSDPNSTVLVKVAPQAGQQVAITI
ncbi:MAG: GAF domain-containing sensor histidine kinase, partial [Phormidesmis sp. CAN_BIN36]|nr:GAF domain-containing sensor histidine kinase [Phormidesmis sp. CAN_BIN36]